MFVSLLYHSSKNRSQIFGSQHNIGRQVRLGRQWGNKESTEGQMDVYWNVQQMLSHEMALCQV